VLGPPQLGVVVDGNATMGRPTLLLPVLGKLGSPRSARVAPPRWGRVRFMVGSSGSPSMGVGGTPWNAELRE